MSTSQKSRKKKKIPGCLPPKNQEKKFWDVYLPKIKKKNSGMSTSQKSRKKIPGCLPPKNQEKKFRDVFLPKIH